MELSHQGSHTRLTSSVGLLRIFSFFLAVLLSSGLYAAGSTTSTQFRCAPHVQNTTKEAPWKCPDPAGGGTITGSNANLYAELSRINYAGGDYTCTYRFVDTSQVSGVCNYVSSYYRTNLKRVQDEILPRLGGNTKGAAYNPTFNLSQFNFLNVSGYPSFIGSKIVPLINSTLGKLTTIYNQAKHVRNSGMASINAHLNEVQQITYENLVRPYVDSTSPVKKEYNFSTFLAGLITLDPGVVKGYNASDGKLEIQPSWKAAASRAEHRRDVGILESIRDGVDSVFQNIISWWRSGPTREKLQNETYGKVDYKLSSWIDIFEMKLWGFYYRFQERMDIGYDYIATQILLLMFAWFASVNGVKSGIQYLLAKRGSSDHNVLVMNEERWMRTLSTVLAVGVFYISIPSGTTTIGGASSSLSPDNEMRKNLTVAKGMIRMAAKEGSYIGTMLSDLGLDSFLSFLIKKENLNSSKEILNSYSYTLGELVYYFPAEQVVNECSKLYHVPPERFTGIMDKTFKNANNPPNDSFFTGNQIGSISYDTCVQSYRSTLLVPYDIVFGSKETQAKIDDLNNRMAKAINFLVRNQVMIEDSFGWVASFSVPVTYFIMKNNDMFLSQGMDYEAIRNSAEAYIKASGMKDGGVISVSDAKTVGGAIGTVWGKTKDYGGYASGWLATQASSLMMWNILPGYGDIYKGIHGYFSEIWTDYVRYEAGDQKERSSGLLKVFTGALKSVKNLVSKVPGIGKLVGILGKGSELISAGMGRTLILIGSALLSIMIWKMAFEVFFIVIIAVAFLVKIGLYFVHLLIHTVTSLFVAAWAFASKEQGYSKMKGYLQRTLVLMLYPALIVVSTYVFIFSYELFYVLYSYIMNILVEGEKLNVSLVLNANTNVDAFSSYFTLNMITEFGLLTVDLFSLAVGLWIVFNLPKIVLTTMGISEEGAMSISGSSHDIYQKSSGNVSPIAV